ncbi:MAG: hypothetical protein JSR33_04455 [Proteobacteria bacterium]|nr:hypothetical protein [Pseudomonadota bacterium]
MNKSFDQFWTKDAEEAKLTGSEFEELGFTLLDSQKIKLQKLYQSVSEDSQKQVMDFLTFCRQFGALPSKETAAAYIQEFEYRCLKDQNLKEIKLISPINNKVAQRQAQSRLLYCLDLTYSKDQRRWTKLAKKKLLKNNFDPQLLPKIIDLLQNHTRIVVQFRRSELSHLGFVNVLTNGKDNLNRTPDQLKHRINVIEKLYQHAITIIREEVTPCYGALEFCNTADSEWGSNIFYGFSYAVLNKSILLNSTFTPGDSVDQYAWDTTPNKELAYCAATFFHLEVFIAQCSKEMLHNLISRVDGIQRTPEELKKLRDAAGYIEVQIPSGLSLFDNKVVEQYHLHSLHQSNAIYLKFIEIIKQKNIKITESHFRNYQSLELPKLLAASKEIKSSLDFELNILMLLTSIITEANKPLTLSFDEYKKSLLWQFADIHCAQRPIIPFLLGAPNLKNKSSIVMGTNVDYHQLQLGIKNKFKNITDVIKPLLLRTIYTVLICGQNTDYWLKHQSYHPKTHGATHHTNLLKNDRSKLDLGYIRDLDWDQSSIVLHLVEHKDTSSDQFPSQVMNHLMRALQLEEKIFRVSEITGKFKQYKMNINIPIIPMLIQLEKYRINYQAVIVEKQGLIAMAERVDPDLGTLGFTPAGGHNSDCYSVPPKGIDSFPPLGVISGLEYEFGLEPIDVAAINRFVLVSNHEKVGTYCIEAGYLKLTQKTHSYTLKKKRAFKADRTEFKQGTENFFDINFKSQVLQKKGLRNLHGVFHYHRYMVEQIKISLNKNVSKDDYIGVEFNDLTSPISPHAVAPGKQYGHLTFTGPKKRIEIYYLCLFFYMAELKRENGVFLHPNYQFDYINTEEKSKLIIKELNPTIVCKVINNQSFRSHLMDYILDIQGIDSKDLPSHDQDSKGAITKNALEVSLYEMLLTPNYGILTAIFVINPSFLCRVKVRNQPPINIILGHATFQHAFEVLRIFRTNATPQWLEQNNELMDDSVFSSTLFFKPILIYKNRELLEQIFNPIQVMAAISTILNLPDTLEISAEFKEAAIQILLAKIYDIFDDNYQLFFRSLTKSKNYSTYIPKLFANRWLFPEKDRFNFRAVVRILHHYPQFATAELASLAMPDTKEPSDRLTWKSRLIDELFLSAPESTAQFNFSILDKIAAVDSTFKELVTRKFNSYPSTKRTEIFDHFGGIINLHGTFKQQDFFNAAEAGDEKAFRKIINQFQNFLTKEAFTKFINSPQPIFEKTAFEIAWNKQHVNCVRILCEIGANIIPDSKNSPKNRFILLYNFASFLKEHFSKYEHNLEIAEQCRIRLSIFILSITFYLQNCKNIFKQIRWVIADCKFMHLPPKTTWNLFKGTIPIYPLTADEGILIPESKPPQYGTHAITYLLYALCSVVTSGSMQSGKIRYKLMDQLNYPSWFYYSFLIKKYREFLLFKSDFTPIETYIRKILWLSSSSKLTFKIQNRVVTEAKHWVELCYSDIKMPRIDKLMQITTLKNAITHFLEFSNQVFPNQQPVSEFSSYFVKYCMDLFAATTEQEKKMIPNSFFKDNLWLTCYFLRTETTRVDVHDRFNNSENYLEDKYKENLFTLLAIQDQPGFTEEYSFLETKIFKTIHAHRIKLQEYKNDQNYEYLNDFKLTYSKHIEYVKTFIYKLITDFDTGASIRLLLWGLFFKVHFEGSKDLAYLTMIFDKDETLAAYFGVYLKSNEVIEWVPTNQESFEDHLDTLEYGIIRFWDSFNQFAYSILGYLQLLNVASTHKIFKHLSTVSNQFIKQLEHRLAKILQARSAFGLNVYCLSYVSLAKLYGLLLIVQTLQDCFMNCFRMHVINIEDTTISEKYLLEKIEGIKKIIYSIQNKIKLGELKIISQGKLLSDIKETKAIQYLDIIEPTKPPSESKFPHNLSGPLTLFSANQQRLKKEMLDQIRLASHLLSSKHSLTYNVYEDTLSDLGRDIESSQNPAGYKEQFDYLMAEVHELTGGTKCIIS